MTQIKAEYMPFVTRKDSSAVVGQGAWRVCVWHQDEWHAIGRSRTEDLPFARQRDAEIAAAALVAAGLDDSRKLTKAGRMKVLQTMFEALQW